MDCDRELAQAERLRKLLARIKYNATLAPATILHRAEVSARYGRCSEAAKLVWAAREQLRTVLILQRGLPAYRLGRGRKPRP